jgi:hypothetical protein
MLTGADEFCSRDKSSRRAWILAVSRSEWVPQACVEDGGAGGLRLGIVR